MVLEKPIPSPSTLRPDIPPALAVAVMRGLEREPARRFDTAHDMAIALEAACAPALPQQVGEWVQAAVGAALEVRDANARTLEASTRTWVPPTRRRPSKVRLPVRLGLAIGLGGLGAFALAAREREVTAPPAPAITSALAAASTSGSAGSPVSSGSDAPAATAPPAHAVPPLPSPRVRARNCRPPYTVDSEGIHIPKPECLAR
jgi:serine/threonine-protein kinase